MTCNQINQLNLTSVAARYSDDGGKTQRLVPFIYLPQEEVWRVHLGRIPTGSNPITYDILAEDEVSEKIYYDDYQGSPFQFPYQKTNQPQTILNQGFKILETLVQAPPYQKLTSNHPVRIQTKVQGNEEVRAGFARITSDSWKTSRDLPLVYSRETTRWEASAGTYPDETEIQFAIYFQKQDGTQVWDNNKDKNYRLKIGPKGFLPGEDEIEEIKENLRKKPIKTLSQNTTAYLNQHKVYASMTTSPDRLRNIHNVIETLDLDHIESVIIALPQFFKNDPKQPYNQETIDELKKRFGDKITIIRPPTDLGPITKIVPAIELIKEKDPQSIVISVDDDIGYPRGMVTELASTLIHNPHSVASGSGQNLDFWNIPRFALRKENGRSFDELLNPELTHTRCDVIEGFGAVGYRPEDLNTDLLKTLAQLPGLDGKRSCKLSDDLVISFALALSGISRFRVSSRYHNKENTQPFEYGLGPDALHHGAGMSSAEDPVNVNQQKYQQCYRDMIHEVFDQSTLQIKPKYLKTPESLKAMDRMPRARSSSQLHPSQSRDRLSCDQERSPQPQSQIDKFYRYIQQFLVQIQNVL